MSIKENYIRVTELLNPWSDLGSIPIATLEAKAKIGTNTHEAIVCHALGLPVRNLTDRENKYFKSYKAWEEKYIPEIILSEQRLYDDEHMITGQIDSIMKIDGKESIIDFKTSAKPDVKKWAIQLGWYAMLCKKNNIEVDMEKAYVVLLTDKDKCAQFIEIGLGVDIFDVCLSIYQAYVYFNPVKK